MGIPGDYGPALEISSWIQVTIATVFVGIRLYVQLKLRSRPWREIFVILGWLCFLIDTICFTLAAERHQFSEYYNYDGYLDDKTMEPLMKIMWVPSLFYKPGLYACKATLLLFYMELTPRFCRKIWWSIWACWVFVGGSCAYQILSNLVNCRPFSLHWSYNNGYCSFNPDLQTAAWSLHTGTDILVFIVPFAILRQLRNLTRKQKLAAYVMFGAGFFNILIAIVFVVEHFYFTFFSAWWNASPWFNHSLDFLGAIQASTGIMIVCMPQVRRLWLGISAEKMTPGLKEDVEKAMKGLQLAGKEGVVVDVSEKGTGMEEVEVNGRERGVGRSE